MSIEGFATSEGTERFAERFSSKLPGHFGEARGLRLSSIGLGTYLGDPTASTDALYRDAVTLAVELGTNVIDSAINYRHQRSERAIGEALSVLIESGRIRRDEIFVSTKGGFLTFDANEPEDPPDYLYRTLIEPGIVRPEEVASGCHVISPKFLEHQIDASRKNLGLATIDLYYLHNPETQLSEVSREEFNRRLRAAFAALEKAVAEGKIRAYGTATWNAYRVTPESREAISLEEVMAAAEEVAGKDHHFIAVQLPFNLALLEALSARTQTFERERLPFLQIARAQKLMVFSSASLLQGQLARGLPDEIRQLFPGLKTDAQRALQFARSTPGISCALVGMSRRDHVEENLATASVARMTLEEYRKMFNR